MRDSAPVRALVLASLVLAPATLSKAVGAQEMHPMIFHYSALEVDASHTSGPTLGQWHGAGWIGGDFNRLWWSTEGEGFDGSIEGAEAALYYGHYFRRFWDVVVGVRQDFEPTAQSYLAVGIMGLAPYWFEVGLFGYLSDRGGPSVRAEAETDLFMTQRWILSLGGEADWLVTEDEERDLAPGISEWRAGVRSRFEIRRKFAPYVDVAWVGEKAPRSAAIPEAEMEGFRIGVGLRLVY